AQALFSDTAAVPSVRDDAPGRSESHLIPRHPREGGDPEGIRALQQVAGTQLCRSPLRVSGFCESGWAALRLAATFADKSAPTRCAAFNGAWPFFMSGGFSTASALVADAAVHQGVAHPARQAVADEGAVGALRMPGFPGQGLAFGIEQQEV